MKYFIKNRYGIAVKKKYQRAHFLSPAIDLNKIDEGDDFNTIFKEYSKFNLPKNCMVCSDIMKDGFCLMLPSIFISNITVETIDILIKNDYNVSDSTGYIKTIFNELTEESRLRVMLYNII